MPDIASISIGDIERVIRDCVRRIIWTSVDPLDIIEERFPTEVAFDTLLRCIQDSIKRQFDVKIDLVGLPAETRAELRGGTYLELAYFVLSLTAAAARQQQLTGRAAAVNQLREWGLQR